MNACTHRIVLAIGTALFHDVHICRHRNLQILGSFIHVLLNQLSKLVFGVLIAVHREIIQEIQINTKWRNIGVHLRQTDLVVMDFDPFDIQFVESGKLIFSDKDSARKVVGVSKGGVRQNVSTLRCTRLQKGNQRLGARHFHRCNDLLDKKLGVGSF